MIQVTRTDKPGILVRKAEEWKTALLKAHKADEKDAIKATEQKYNHPHVKASLISMFHGKCAYCEAAISHVSYGDIEHFRPKSIFPELCFEWTNLLLACSICNGASYKGDQFPDASEGGPLVNPVDENPSEFFEFEYDPSTRLAQVNWKNLRGEKSIEVFGLNRNNLIRHRSETVFKLLRIAKEARSGDAEAIEIILKSCQPDAEYAAFGRMIADLIQLEWRKP